MNRVDPLTQAAIKKALRSVSLKSPQRKEALERACIGQELNPLTNRMSKHYQCAHCKNTYIKTDVHVDHISPVVPLSGFDSWDGLIDRLFFGDMQVLCVQCHKKKSREEASERKKCRNNTQENS